MQTLFCGKVQHKELINDPINKGSSRFVYIPKDWRDERIKQGIYTPKIWFQDDFKNPKNKIFFIEVSVPKFIYGHNAIIPKDSDLETFVKKIQDLLSEIGARKIFSKEILDTTPSLVAFGCNMDFTKVCSCDQAIETLSAFDDRFRSECHTIKPKNGGNELYYSTKASTLKVYSKLPEMKNNSITPQEKMFVESYLQKRHRSKKIWVCELLRAELTLKGMGSVRKRLKPFCGEEITLENMFKNEMWDELLRNEIERIFVHPLQDFIFLSKLQAPILEAVLDKNIKHIDKRLRLKDAIEKIQTSGGLKNFKGYTFEKYKSRQTYYNHLKILDSLVKNIDFSSFGKLTSKEIHKHFLEYFNLKSPPQSKLL